MYALTSATARRLIVLSRERGDSEIPALELRWIDDHAIHYARLDADSANAGVYVLALALRLRGRRGSQHVVIYLDDVATADLLVPVSLLVEDLAARELAAWPAPQDVVALASVPEHP